MKNIFKKIGYSLLVLLVIFGGVHLLDSTKVSAAIPGGGQAPTKPTENQTILNNIRPLIHRGGGDQWVTGALGILGTPLTSFDATSNSARPSFFEHPSRIDDNSSSRSFLGTLGNSSWLGGNMFVGFPRGNSTYVGFDYQEVFDYRNWTQDSWFIGLPNLQKVNVEGRVLATNLVENPFSKGGLYEVCIEPTGSLVICSNFSCTGTIPSNSVMCPGDNVDLTADTALSLVASCGAPKCEYECAVGYHYDGNSCVANSCTGATPGNATLCSGDDQNLTTNTARTAVDECTVPVKCEYECDNNYHLEGGTCVPDGLSWRCDGTNWKEYPNIANQNSCSPINYDIDLGYLTDAIVCNNVQPNNTNCGEGGGGGEPVPGATVWYCHLNDNWTEVVGSTCDNENFPSGYIWGQVHVCTTATPQSSECSQGTPPPTAPATADCIGAGGNHWTCTD